MNPRRDWEGAASLPSSRSFPDLDDFHNIIPHTNFHSAFQTLVTRSLLRPKAVHEEHYEEFTNRYMYFTPKDR